MARAQVDSHVDDSESLGGQVEPLFYRCARPSHRGEQVSLNKHEIKGALKLGSDICPALRHIECNNPRRSS
ncbi:hypothetical protein PTKU64_87140 [Paraburkholderia terrae]|uniref:Uncharacterized protein n=1 Tax=Paraburkholderia terrae TaxID=311230 RepID=A0ABN6JVR6_9BURK|nr:hypothetical protein PTKU64_87140 [Paraburkholderia terrae]BDC45000.1 hypothetical protein PTKU15_82970 [Paraburkholderia terrae]